MEDGQAPGLSARRVSEKSISRRQFLQAGALGTMALTLPKIVWADGKKILKVRDYSTVESFDPAVHSRLPEEPFQPIWMTGLA